MGPWHTAGSHRRCAACAAAHLIARPLCSGVHWASTRRLQPTGCISRRHGFQKYWRLAGIGICLHLGHRESGVLNTGWCCRTPPTLYNSTIFSWISDSLNSSRAMRRRGTVQFFFLFTRSLLSLYLLSAASGAPQRWPGRTSVYEQVN